jgi:hypothetical protein
LEVVLALEADGLLEVEVQGTGDLVDLVWPDGPRSAFEIPYGDGEDAGKGAGAAGGDLAGELKAEEGIESDVDARAGGEGDVGELVVEGAVAVGASLDRRLGGLARPGYERLAAGGVMAGTETGLAAGYARALRPAAGAGVADGELPLVAAG